MGKERLGESLTSFWIRIRRIRIGIRRRIRTEKDMDNDRGARRQKQEAYNGRL